MKKNKKRAFWIVAGTAAICLGMVMLPEVSGNRFNVFGVSAASESDNTVSGSDAQYVSFTDFVSSTVSSTDVTPVEKISLSNTSIDLGKGKSVTLVASVMPETATETVKWSSSNTAIATVSGNGVVTAVGHGVAVITAKAGKVSASCEIVCQPSIKLDTLGASIRISEPYGLRFGIQLQKDEEYIMTDIVEYGTILIPSAKMPSDGELSLDTPSVKKIKAVNLLSETQSTIVYTGVLINIPKDQFPSEILGRGYLIYRDAAGNTHTLYSSVVTNSFDGVVKLAYDKYTKISNPSFSEKLIVHRLEAIMAGGPVGGLIYLAPSRQDDNEYAYGDTTEYEQMYRVAAATTKYLEAAGFNVYTAPYELKIAVRDEDAAKRKAVCYVAIHSNAVNRSKRGTLALYYSKSPDSIKLANYVCDKVSALTPHNDEGARSGDTYIEVYQPTQRNVPSTLVEVDYHDSVAGAKWIINNTDKLGKAIADGIMEYMLS